MRLNVLFPQNDTNGSTLPITTRISLLIHRLQGHSFMVKQGMNSEEIYVCLSKTMPYWWFQDEALGNQYENTSTVSATPHIQTQKSSKNSSPQSNLKEFPFILYLIQAQVLNSQNIWLRPTVTQRRRFNRFMNRDTNLQWCYSVDSYLKRNLSSTNSFLRRNTNLWKRNVCLIRRGQDLL